MTTTITINDVLRQAADTAELTEDFSVDGLWDYAFTTTAACDETGQLDFTMEQLESVFNEMSETARGLGISVFQFIKETLQ